LTLQQELKRLQAAYDTAEDKEMALRNIQRILNIVADRNLYGQQLEKQGNIGDAIRVYQQNVEDEVDTPFPYMRLAVLYHKAHAYPAEIWILEKGISICNTPQTATSYKWMVKRLNKIRGKP